MDAGTTESCFVKACETTNIAYEEGKLKVVHGQNIQKVFENLWKNELGADHVAFPHRVKQSVDAFRKLMEEELEKNDLHLTIGTNEALAHLKSNGIKVAITTELDRWLADIVLEKLGWLEGLNNDYVGNEDSIIQLSVCSEDVEKGRPAPDMIAYAMDMFEIEDSGVVINIGDTTMDLRSARKAACGLNLAVSNGAHSEETLEAKENHGILESLVDLPAFLDVKIAEKAAEPDPVVEEETTEEEATEASLPQE